MPNRSVKGEEEIEGVIVLPRPTPEDAGVVVEDPKKADGDGDDDGFGDLEIVIDDDEVEAENNRVPSGRKS